LRKKNINRFICTMKNLKTNDRRSKNAISMIWAVLALSTISFLFSFFESLFVNEINEEEGNISYLLFYLAYSLPLFLNFAVAVASIVTFIMWFRRAYNNLHQLRGNLSYNESWAASSWFIPIMNLYVPYRIMKELYNGTSTLLSQNLETCTTRLKADYLVWWWTLWIITGIFGQISFRAYWNDNADIGLPADIISALLLIPLAVVTVIVIKDYAEVEPLLYETYQGDMSDTEEGDHSGSFVE